MLQVVRLLSRLMTQRTESWTTSQHSSCQCDAEVSLTHTRTHTLTQIFKCSDTNYFFNPPCVSLRSFRQWWLFSIVSGWIFVIVRNQRTPQVSHAPASFSSVISALVKSDVDVKLFLTHCSASKNITDCCQVLTIQFLKSLMTLPMFDCHLNLFCTYYK